jgi:hypothetical protein
MAPPGSRTVKVNENLYVYETADEAMEAVGEHLARALVARRRNVEITYAGDRWLIDHSSVTVRSEEAP